MGVQPQHDSTPKTWHEDMTERALWSWIGLILISIFIAGFICGAVWS